MSYQNVDPHPPKSKIDRILCAVAQAEHTTPEEVELVLKETLYLAKKYGSADSPLENLSENGEPSIEKIIAWAVAQLLDAPPVSPRKASDSLSPRLTSKSSGDIINTKHCK